MYKHLVIKEIRGVCLVKLTQLNLQCDVEGVVR